jgi:hypothetical protein
VGSNLWKDKYTDDILGMNIFTPTDYLTSVLCMVCDNLGQARVVMFGGTLEAGSLDEGTHI